MTGMGFCKLCCQNKRLVRAHIIPKAFWDTSDEPIAMFNSRPDGRAMRSRIGPYDENILCEACDNHLGVLDGHAAKYLLRARPRHSPFVDVHFYRDADPDVIERFVWSVAWRASISSQMLFKNVKLGNLERRLAVALRTSRSWPLKSSVVISEFDKSVPTLSPEFATIDKTKFLIIYANRFFFTLKIDIGPIPAAMRDFCLTKGMPTYSVRYEWEGSAHQQRIYENLKRIPRPQFWSGSPYRLSLGTNKFRHY